MNADLNGRRDGTDADDADRSPWDTIDHLRSWLDAGTGIRPEQDLLLRMLKLSEEVGEVAQAVIGTIGQNPRKGVTHSWQDVEAELCDVIVTAMVALRTLTPEAPQVFEGHLRRIAARVPSPERTGEADDAPGS
ncbi:MazG-like family protein [Streptomyces sp. NBC_01320]|uniref:MazG-like family protein n=1 Tax=Streptomyces sp. NBC_01320 TaxID=2903824 RepID=UPI002E0E2B26|nr:MazG-like family protein [Streptomyces sp. NBC_01320]